MKELRIIKTEQEYELAIKEIEDLLDLNEDSERIEILSILVEDYENKNHKIEEPDPIEAIKFRMEQLGLARSDLEGAIGPRSRVSEIQNRKRNLTLPMIRKLHKQLKIPADILIRQTKAG